MNPSTARRAARSCAPRTSHRPARPDGTATGDHPASPRFPGRLCRLHDLRHTTATLWLQAGVNPKIVSERLGHHSTAFTLDVYSHVLPGMQAKAAQHVARVLRAHREPPAPAPPEDTDSTPRRTLLNIDDPAPCPGRPAAKCVPIGRIRVPGSGPRSRSRDPRRTRRLRRQRARSPKRRIRPRGPDSRCALGGIRTPGRLIRSRNRAVAAPGGPGRNMPLSRENSSQKVRRRRCLHAESSLSRVPLVYPERPESSDPQSGDRRFGDLPRLAWPPGRDRPPERARAAVAP
nr:tyrosine-type recombinase/integrase [Salsipaludibacter albus]